MKYGVQLYSLRKYLKDIKSYENIFENVKAMGGEIVQISTTGSWVPAPDKLKELSEKFELPICITHAPWKRISDDLDRLAEEHLIFGCKNIGVGMMPKEYRKAKFDGTKFFVDKLNTASEKLKKYDMSISYHNHWFEFDKYDGITMYDYMIENTLSEVKFIPDTYWIKFGKGDVNEYLKKLDNRINTLHLKDYKNKVFCSVGSGVLNFESILKQAKKSSAENCVVEIDFALNPLKSVEKSMHYINSIKGGIG